MDGKVLTLTVLIVFSSYFVHNSYAQKANLLQRYIQQYFKDYYQSDIRSYTLHGNGQNGPADYHAGLPYAHDKTGRVQSLVYNNAASQSSSPQMSRSSGVMNDGSWSQAHPTQNNNFYSRPVYPPMQQAISTVHVPHLSRFDLPPRPATNLALPQAPIFQQPQEQNPGPEPFPELRLVIEGKPEVAMENVNLNKDGNVEISVQSTMSV